MNTTTDKTREIRLRRSAQRQGLALHKSRLRDPRAIGYGLFNLSDESNRIVAGGDAGGYSMSLDEIEIYLADAQDFDVYFENPCGDYRLNDPRPVMEWTGREWMATTRDDSPQLLVFGGARSDLAYVAALARKGLSNLDR